LESRTPHIETVSEDPDFETVVGLLEDEYARSILTALSEEPMSASELSERCDHSLPTVYRRTDRLVAAGLVAERTRPRSDGHHDTVYVARLDELSVRLRDGELRYEVEHREEPDVADRLTNMWEEL